MKNLIPLLLIVLCGCASPPMPYQVKLDSEPQGARVFLSLNALSKQSGKIREDVNTAGGRDYLGITPCTVTVMGTKSQDFILPQVKFVSKYVGGSAIFIADPPSDSTNLYTQTVIFRGRSKYVDGDKIPTGVFFDMHMKPTQ